MKPKTQAKKEKMDKLDFIKVKNIFVSKDTIKKVKRLQNGGKYFQITCDTRFVTRIYKEKLQPQNKKTN